MLLQDSDEETNRNRLLPASFVGASVFFFYTRFSDQPVTGAEIWALSLSDTHGLKLNVSTACDCLSV